MHFEDERYIRVYTRKTLTYRLIRWEGRTVLWHLMLEVDRAGVFDLNGEDVFDAVTAMTELPEELVRVGLQRLIDRGVVRVTRDLLVVVKFIEAQEANQSDQQRQRESRQRRRDLAKRSAVIGDVVTECDTPTPDQDDAVTNCDSQSHELENGGGNVTLCCAVPSSTDQPPTPSEGGSFEDDPQEPVDAPTDAKAPQDPTAGLTPQVDPADEVVTKVFEFWKREHGHPKAKLERKRRSRIKARLREGFTGRELCLAIRGAKQDRFLMGENDRGQVYDGLSTLLRDAEQVERLMALAGARRAVSNGSAASDAEESAAVLREIERRQSGAEVAAS